MGINHIFLKSEIYFLNTMVKNMMKFHPNNICQKYLEIYNQTLANSTFFSQTKNSCGKNMYKQQSYLGHIGGSIKSKS